MECAEECSDESITNVGLVNGIGNDGIRSVGGEPQCLRFLPAGDLLRGIPQDT